MNVLSCFDGMSCGQLALQRIGAHIDNYFACEIDKYAIQITQKNFPATIQLGDVCTISGRALPKIDLLIGGSPCQGFSIAGTQLNFDDPRSALFFEYVRLYKELKKINPDLIFLLENVKMNKAYQDIITEHMGVAPLLINSSLVSAQNRQRLYWTNITGIDLPMNKNIKLADVLESGVVDRNKSYCIDANYWKGTNVAQYLAKRRRQIVFTKHNDHTAFRKLTPLECERLQTVPDNYTAGVSDTQRYRMLGNGWTVDVIAHILSYNL